MAYTEASNYKQKTTDYQKRNKTQKNKQDLWTLPGELATE